MKTTVPFVAGAELLNIIPRKKSGLAFRLPATTVRGPLDKLARENPLFTKTLDAGAGSPSFDQFVFDLELPAMSAREFLNQLVASQSGLTWQHAPWVASPKTQFGSYGTGEQRWKGVFLAYDVPEMSESLALRSERIARWKYVSRVIGIDGRSAIVVEKRKLTAIGLYSKNQTERDLSRRYIDAIDAIINEDIDSFMELVSPSSIKIGGETCTTNIARERVTAEFGQHDYTQFFLGDVIDPKKYRIDQLSPKSYRLSLHPSAKDAKELRFFGGEFWLVFEQTAENKWFIIEMP